MGSAKMKLFLQLTLTLGLCYLAVAQKCEPGSSSQVCCQQVTECNGICSDEHPEPGNEANWYSDSFCHEKSGCRCWKKGQCCELENRRCDYINGTCTLGKPPKDAYMQAFSHVTGKKTASAGNENRVSKTTDNARRKMEFASISRQAKATGSKADIVTGSLIVNAGSKKKKIVMDIVPSKVTNALGRFFQNFGSVRMRNAAMTAALAGDSVNQHNGVQAKKEDVGQNPQGFHTKPLAFATSKVAIAGDNVNKTQPVLRQGKCLARHPGFSYEMIGICRQGCRCYRSCHDQQCAARGGTCSVKAPAFHTKIGQCKGNCSCWKKYQKWDSVKEIFTVE